MVADDNPDNLALSLWGKSSPYKPLICHMIDTGVMAQELLTRSCMSSVTHYLANIFQTDVANIHVVIGFLAAIHDVGKCHPSFQVKGEGLEIVDKLRNLELFQSNYGDLFRHERYSEKVFRRFAQNTGLRGQAMRMAGAALRLHHQGKQGKGDEPSDRLKHTW